MKLPLLALHVFTVCTPFVLVVYIVLQLGVPCSGPRCVVFDVGGTSNASSTYQQSADRWMWLAPSKWCAQHGLRLWTTIHIDRAAEPSGLYVPALVMTLCL